MTLFQMVKLAMFAAGISPDWTPPPQLHNNVPDIDNKETVKPIYSHSFSRALDNARNLI